MQEVYYQKLAIFVYSLTIKNPFDVITISETWLKPSVTNAEISITNYSIARQDRNDKTGGEL